MQPYVDDKLCVTCGACEDVCPAEPNVFSVEEVAKVVNPQLCIVCKACEEACPTDAIEVK